jgi:hypothetical protein
VFTLMSVGLLAACDAFPNLFPAPTHDLLAAVPLVSIALAYAAYQAARRASGAEWAKTALVAVAFFFWAANQVCRDRRLATIFNDVAIAAFVLDVFLVIVSKPASQRSGSKGPPRPTENAAPAAIR